MQVSIVSFLNLNPELRIDAEYYRAEILSKINLLDSIKNSALKNLASFVIGPFGSTVTVEKYVEHSAFRYVRNKDINDFLIDDSDPAYVTEEIYNSLPHFHIRENDLLITVVGTLGKVAIARHKDTKSIYSCKSTIIRVKNIDPYYLAAYLNSSIGQLLVNRGVRGAIQQGLNLSDLQEIKVFTPSEVFQARIREIVISSFKAIDKSKIMYNEAEQILLSDLNLIDWKPVHKLSFIRDFSDTKVAERIDAEYYQPMYEDVEHILGQKDRRSLESICSLINYGTVPTSPYTDNGTPYIKGLNIVDGFIQGDFDFITSTSALATKFYTKEHDIIISQMGTVGKAGIVLKEQEDWLFASFTIRARLKNYDYIDPFVLTMYINSIAREWYLMRQIAQASVRQNTDLPTIKNLQVPKIGKGIQDKIASKIKESYRLKRNSKELLNIAKQGVEMAINTDEATAIKGINEEVKKLCLGT